MAEIAAAAVDIAAAAEVDKLLVADASSSADAAADRTNIVAVAAAFVQEIVVVGNCCTEVASECYIPYSYSSAAASVAAYSYLDYYCCTFAAGAADIEAVDMPPVEPVVELVVVVVELGSYF